jgi:salicylate hydroxylase
MTLPAMADFFDRLTLAEATYAFALSKCVRGITADALPAALLRYEEIRKPRGSHVQARARQNGVTFHLPDGDAQRERDARLAASAGTNPLLASAWLYGHDVEAGI